jgi:hypothetical protein
LNDAPKKPHSVFTPVRIIALIIWLFGFNILLSILVSNISNNFWLTFCLIAGSIFVLSFFRKKDLSVFEQLIDMIAWLTVAASVIAILFVGFVFASCLLH